MLSSQIIIETNIASFLTDMDALDKEIIAYKNNLKLYYEKKIEIEKTEELRNKLNILYKQAQTLQSEKKLAFWQCDMLQDCIDNLDNLLRYRSTNQEYNLKNYVIPTMDTFWDLKYRLQNKFLTPPQKISDSHIIEINSLANLNHLPIELIYSILKQNLNGTKAENKLAMANYRFVSKRFRNVINAIDNTYLSASHFATLKQDEILPLKVYSNIFSYLNRDEQNKLRILCKNFHNIIDALEPNLAMLRSLHSSLLDPKLTIATFREIAEQTIIKELDLDHVYWMEDREQETYQLYKKLIAKLTKEISDRGWDLRNNNRNVDYSRGLGLINLAPFSVALIATITLFSCNMNYMWDHCFQKDFDAALCQHEANTMMGLQFSTQVTWGATVGFFSKFIANMIFACMLDNLIEDDAYIPIRPTLFTRWDNLRYNIIKFFHDSTFYREIPVLATAGYLSSLINEKKPYTLNINDCNNAHYGVDLECMVNKMEGTRKDDFNLNFMDGFLYAYSTLSILYLLYRFMNVLCDRGKQYYQAYQRDRLFTQPQQPLSSVVIEEMNEDDEQERLIKRPN